MCDGMHVGGCFMCEGSSGLICGCMCNKLSGGHLEDGMCVRDSVCA